MPRYHLIFPALPGDPIESAPTAEIDTGAEVYDVGAEFEYNGRRWRVSETTLEQQDSEESADLLVWPAD